MAIARAGHRNVAIGNIRLKLALLGAGLCVALGCAAPQGTVSPPFEENHFPSCQPDFPYEEGWLGGDAAYSVPLRGGERSLWLFGDSFVGDAQATARDGSSLIHNSIAISQCDSHGGWQVDYFWNHDAKGQARDFFSSSEPGAYYWPFDGVLIHEVLYVGLLVVQPSDPQPPLGLPFVLSGMKIARISNWQEGPRNWQVEVSNLSSNPSIFPASAMTVVEDYLYLFSFRATDNKRGLARIAVAKLEANFQQLEPDLEQLGRNGDWESGLSVAGSAVLMEDAATEMSVNYHPDLERWVAVYSTVPTAPSEDAGRVYMRAAESVKGPWTQPVELYDPNEAESPESFCYAGKEHAQFAMRDSFLITYVCNLLPASGEASLSTLTRLVKRLDLYRPEVVRLQKKSVPIP